MNINFKKIFIETLLLMMSSLICFLVVYASIYTNESFINRVGMYFGVIVSMPLGGLSWLFYYLWQINSETVYFSIWTGILFLSIYFNIRFIRSYYFPNSR